MLCYSNGTDNYKPMSDMCQHIMRPLA